MLVVCHYILFIPALIFIYIYIYIYIFLKTICIGFHKMTAVFLADSMFPVLLLLLMWEKLYFTAISCYQTICYVRLFDKVLQSFIVSSILLPKFTNDRKFHFLIVECPVSLLGIFMPKKIETQTMTCLILWRIFQLYQLQASHQCSLNI